MCIAILKKPGKTISDETLYECFKSNGDGCGFAYINTDHQGNRKIVVKKTMEFPNFLEKYHKALRNAPDSPFLIHFRIRTHGTKDIFNCHPFVIDKSLVFIHNGVITGMTPDAKKSDTQMFNENYLQKLPKDWFHNGPILDLIERAVSYNKLIFLNINGEFEIINELKGDWVDGVWYSNTTYKPSQYGYHSNGFNRDRHTQTTVSSNVHPIKPESVLTLESKVTCDNCTNKNFLLKDATCYYYMGVCCVYCKHCEATISDKAFAKRGSVITPSCYLDWIDSKPNMVANTQSYYLRSWENPWNLNGLDDEDQDIALITYEQQMEEDLEESFSLVGAF